MADLKEGMILEGVVTNVTAFGAFVDVGVHQDGLVHISQISDRFIKDPREAVKVGDKLRVRVMEVDLVRSRIGLSAKSGDAQNKVGGAHGARPQESRNPPHGSPRNPPHGNPRHAPQGNSRPAEPARPTLASKFSNNPFANLGPKK
jgi:uncharacterized protein